MTEATLLTSTQYLFYVCKSSHFVGIMNSLRYILLQQTTHGIFHFYISHWVNYRIQHGSEDCKEHSYQLVHRVSSHRSCVAEYTRDKVEYHHCKVSTTCGEGFALSCRAMGFQGAQDSDVGDEEHGKNEQAHGPTVGCHYNSDLVCVATGNFQK